MTLARAPADTRRRTVTFVVIAAGVSSYATVQSLVGPVLATLQHQLHTTQSAMTWVVTAYLLSASIFTPIAGRIGDQRGKQRMFVLALLCLAVGSLIGALATNVSLLIVARLVQGVGGGVLPLGFGIIRDQFSDEKVASAVGAVASLTAVGGGLGTILAGPIVDGLGYHWLFWLPMIVTLVAAGAAWRFVQPSPTDGGTAIAVVPALFLSAWLTAILLAVSQGPSWGWGSRRVLGLIGVALLGVVLWVRAERRSVNPMIDLELMRRRPVWTLNLVAFLVGVGIYSIFAFLPQFLQTPPDRAGYGFGATVTESGLIVIPSAAATLVIGSLCGRLVARFGAKSMIILGCSGGGCAALLMAFVHSHTWQISIASSILGASFGLSFSAMSGLVVAVVRLTETGVASGMNANIRTIGGAVGAAAVGSIVTSTVQANGFPTESGYSLAFAAVALAMLGAALAGTIIPEGVVRRGVDVVTHVMPEAVGVAPSLVSSHGVAAPSAPGARAARPSVRGA